MRTIDLAVYADSLAAEAAALAVRLERLRGALRRASIEHEARQALAPDVVARLERVGVLVARQTASLSGEIAEIQATLRALEALQAWVEAQIASGRAAARRAPVCVAGAVTAPRPDPSTGGDGSPTLVEEPAMSR